MSRARALLLWCIASGLFVVAPLTRAEEPDAWIKRWQQNAAEASPTPIGSLPPRQLAPPAKKIPRSWIIAGVSTAAVGAALFLALSWKAWRAANVFGRRYRFRVVADKPTRLGAQRCGGHIATAHFGPARR